MAMSSSTPVHTPMYEQSDAFLSPSADPDRKSIFAVEDPKDPGDGVDGDEDDVKKPPKQTVVWTKGRAEFVRSVKGWARQTFTLRFLLAALAGQFVSVCITATNVEVGRARPFVKERESPAESGLCD